MVHLVASWHTGSQVSKYAVSNYNTIAVQEKLISTSMCSQHQRKTNTCNKYQDIFTNYYRYQLQLLLFTKVQKLAGTAGKDLYRGYLSGGPARGLWTQDRRSEGRGNIKQCFQENFQEKP